MSAKERKRKSIFDMVKGGIHTLKEASGILKLSYRQSRRSYKRYREQGDKGLLHRSRGRTSNRAAPEGFKGSIIERYRERYAGFGPTLASEYLEEDGYKIDHETLRRWLIGQGDWHRKKRRSKHRSRRERRECFGELIQLDGSHHQWFGADTSQCCLMNMVDDATGVTMALLAEEETSKAAMLILWRWIEHFGIPRALYTDKKNVYVTDREPSIEEQLAGEVPLTAFGKACACLGIEIIPADSPLKPKGGWSAHTAFTRIALSRNFI